MRLWILLQLLKRRNMNKITLEINGKERLFKFDMYALELMTTDDRFKGQFNYIASMVHAGLTSACYSKDIEPDFTKEDVIDMVDELALTEAGKEKLKLLNDCFAQSQAFKALIEKMNDTDEKKRLIGTGLEPLHLVKSA